jgi:hypothetical protein
MQKNYNILPQSSTAILTAYDPSVFHRELQNNYRILPQSPTDIPTPSPIDIPTPSPMDNAHSNAHDCQTSWSVGTIIDGFANERGKSKASVL